LLPFGPESSVFPTAFQECKVKISLYKTIILPFVLYGCETWSLTLREEHRLREFENRVLRRVFGPKRDEVTGEWRKLQNEDLHIYTSPQMLLRQIKSRPMRWAGHLACMGEECVQGFDGKPRKKETIWKTKRRWEDGIRIDLREIGWGSIDWIQLAQDRDRWRAVANTVMHRRVLAPRS
jgi:hypothetical protein